MSNVSYIRGSPFAMAGQGRRGLERFIFRQYFVVEKRFLISRGVCSTYLLTSAFGLQI